MFLFCEMGVVNNSLQLSLHFVVILFKLLQSSLVFVFVSFGQFFNQLEIDFANLLNQSIVKL